MTTSGKQLSSPFATGGGGGRFEAHIQANFLTLMLSGGYAPCLPTWPIVEINLQGKVDGFETDDLIVYVADPVTSERRKLLGQVKHAISITARDETFRDVIQAAWLDFNNDALFEKGKDLIALITGHLTKSDTDGLGYLIEQALHVRDAEEFISHIERGRFSSNTAREKLEALREQLKLANNGDDLSDQEVFEFLKHFRLLGYDLDRRTGVISSLLQSHIAQFNREIPGAIWAQILETVQGFNQQAGTITKENLSEGLLEYFKSRPVVVMPEDYTSKPAKPETIPDWNTVADADILAQACLIGSWNEGKEADLSRISQFVEAEYKDWVKPLRNILQSENSPLKFKNGIWSVHDPVAVWTQMGGRVFDHHLELLMNLALDVLSECNPAFELPSEQRYAASIYGKELRHSSGLRKGLAETIAYVANNREQFANCSTGKIENAVFKLIRTLFADADWTLWGSLNNLLPTLAEVSPTRFLAAVEGAVSDTPCPFVELFNQEDSGIFGANYISGLLWALELLAWDEEFLVRVCVVLAEIAAHDPGGNYTNRPINSLTEILLPWLPQTLASIRVRKIAISTVCREQEVVGWRLLGSLLPNQHTTASETHRPRWRKTIPSDEEQRVSQAEYREMSEFCACMSVEKAAEDLIKQEELVSLFDSLPQKAANDLLTAIQEQKQNDTDEEKYFPIWLKLVEFVSEHRRFLGAEWSLSEEELAPLDAAISDLEPVNPLRKHHRLFSAHYSELISPYGDDTQEEQALLGQRVAAIKEIIGFGGIEAVLEFINSVKQPQDVGFTLANLGDFDSDLLPKYLQNTTLSESMFISYYAGSRCGNEGWEWVDQIIESFTDGKDKALLLSLLSFCQEAWTRADLLPEPSQQEYWSKVSTHCSNSQEDLQPAIRKLVHFGRPMAAIDCFGTILYRKQAIDFDLACEALTKALQSSEPSSSIYGHTLLKLIEHLQLSPLADKSKLAQIEWAYLPLLDGHHGNLPKTLHQKLADDADFYCSMIQRVYRPKGVEVPETPSEENEQAATNAYRLLHKWKRIPGQQPDGSFSGSAFTSWLKQIETKTNASGHFDVAMLSLGESLYNSPPSSDGFWIDHEIAKALNERKHEKLRRGFFIGIRNSRGVYTIDPSGSPEKKLADQYQAQAQLTEEVGYQRLASTLREVADSYGREAESIAGDDRCN